VRNCQQVYPCSNNLTLAFEFKALSNGVGILAIQSTSEASGVNDVRCGLERIFRKWLDVDSQGSQLQDGIVFQIIALRAENYMHSKRTYSQNTPPALDSRVTSHMTLRLSFLSGHHWITELLTKSPTTKFPLQHQPFRHLWILQRRNLQYRQNASRNLRHQERESALILSKRELGRNMLIEK